MIPPVAASPAPMMQPENRTVLRQKSQELEAAFLSEMLGYAGLGQAQESFGGGIGEDQFASFLRQEQADAMVKSGGIGLAESLFQALTKAEEKAHG